MPAASLPAPAPVAHAVWWRYLERARAHEVLAQWQTTTGLLRVRESVPGDATAAFEDVHRVAHPWEARVALWELECRLGLLGSYWKQRASDATWRRLVAPAGAPTPDPRPNMVVHAPHAPLIHHYHDPRGGGDRFLAALKSSTPSRYVVLRAQLDVPSLEIGRIDVITPRAPDVVTRSLVLREQLTLTQAGLGKLVSRDDYVRAFGYGGEARAARLVQETVLRVSRGELARPVPRPEDSDAYQEFLVTLNDPRLLALHKRFLLGGEEEKLLAGGPLAIKKAVHEKRARAAHNDQHLLTILEASLLARERMRAGTLVRTDPEVRALTRLAYYL